MRRRRGGFRGPEAEDEGGVLYFMVSQHIHLCKRWATKDGISDAICPCIRIQTQMYRYHTLLPLRVGVPFEHPHETASSTSSRIRPWNTHPSISHPFHRLSLQAERASLSQPGYTDLLFAPSGIYALTLSHTPYPKLPLIASPPPTTHLRVYSPYLPIHDSRSSCPFRRCALSRVLLRIVEKPGSRRTMIRIHCSIPSRRNGHHLQAKALD